MTAAVALVPDHDGWWPAAAAAAIAALLLIPLRETPQRAVNRIVYGRWHEPYEVLASLGERLEAAADVDRLLDAAVTELTTGLDLRDVSVRDLDGQAIAGAAAAPQPGARSAYAGWMLALWWNRFCGSYSFLIAASRWYLAGP